MASVLAHCWIAPVLAHCWVCVDRAHPNRLLPSSHHLPSALLDLLLNLFCRVSSARLSQLLEAKKAADVEEALQRTERHRVFWEAKALEKKMCLSKQEALSSRFLSLDAAERAQQIGDLLEDEISYTSLERKY